MDITSLGFLLFLGGGVTPVSYTHLDVYKRQVLAEWGGQDITIRFAASGGLEQLVRLLMPYIDKEKVRRGARLVVGGN